MEFVTDKHMHYTRLNAFNWMHTEYDKYKLLMTCHYECSDQGCSEIKISDSFLIANYLLRTEISYVEMPIILGHDTMTQP